MSTAGAMAPEPRTDASQPDAAESDAGTDAATADAAEPLPPPRFYVMTNEIYTGEESATYLHVLDTLDIDGIGNGEGVEFAGGRATIATIGGWKSRHSACAAATARPA